MSRTRIYCVSERKPGGAGRLVRAASPAMAVRIVADSLYFVDVASQDDCVRFAAAGALDEKSAPVVAWTEPQASSDPEPAAEPERCPHGNWPHDCNACDVASDHAFDAAREARTFR